MLAAQHGSTDDGPLLSGPSRRTPQVSGLLRHRSKLALAVGCLCILAVFRMARRPEPVIEDPGPASSLEARLGYIAARRRAAVRKPVKRIWQIHLGQDESKSQAFQWSWRLFNPSWSHEVRRTT